MSQEKPYMNIDHPIKHEYNSKYAQSSNSLFNFMSKEEYLLEALTKQALIPHFVIEDIEYLKIEVSGDEFKELLILQNH